MSAAEALLTVHVLDTARGSPASGMTLRLSRDGAALAERVTNSDGRCDSPMLAGDAFSPGIYEMAFEVAAWREGQGDLGFYDRIVIRFTVGAAPGHVHIPLLLSPYGYSTYKGS